MTPASSLRRGTSSRKLLGELVGLPQSQPFEAPSSWLTRAAISQGASPRELLAFMGLNGGYFRRVDPDILLTSRQGLAVLRTAGGLASFPIAARVFLGLRSIDPKGEALLRDQRGRPRCRYCPVCLREHRISHLEVHGRLAPWRYCPLHNCLMEDRCPHCAAEVLLPFDMLKGGPKQQGIAFLSECQCCGRKLHTVQEISLDRLQITAFAWSCLRNGRALLSALVRSEALLQDGRRVQLRHLSHYLRAVTFWRPKTWHLAHEVREAER